MNACKTGSGTNRSKAAHSDAHILICMYMSILARAHSTYYSDYLQLSGCLNNSQTKAHLLDPVSVSPRCPTYDEEDTIITCLSGSETSGVANNLEKHNNRVSRIQMVWI